MVFLSDIGLEKSSIFLNYQRLLLIESQVYNCACKLVNEKCCSYAQQFIDVQDVSIVTCEDSNYDVKNRGLRLSISFFINQMILNSFIK